MKAKREPLEDTQIQRLVVTDSGRADTPTGVVVGYLCPECMASDETLGQIYHEEDCSLAGQHGRRYYGDLAPDVLDGPSPELDPANPISVVTAAETEGYGGLHEGEVLAFRCECGNSDETLWEIVHDEACPLAGRHVETLADAREIQAEAMGD